jgi:enoyl-CoA hydratase
VNRVVPAAEVVSASTAMMQQILANAPLALAGCIETVDRGFDASLDDALTLEATQFGLLASTKDMAEGTRAFLEKRAARFTGH